MAAGGKGSQQRKSQVPDEVVADNWEKAFGKKKEKSEVKNTEPQRELINLVELSMIAKGYAERATGEVLTQITMQENPLPSLLKSTVIEGVQYWDKLEVIAYFDKFFGTVSPTSFGREAEWHPHVRVPSKDQID